MADLKTLIANVIEPIKEILGLIGKIPGFGLAGDAAKSLQKYQDASTGNEKPVNKDASIITQKKILETNSSQNVQINIDDSTGRARVGGNTSAIPVLINNTKSFDWYGRKDFKDIPTEAIKMLVDKDHLSAALVMSSQYFIVKYRAAPRATTPATIQVIGLAHIAALHAQVLFEVSQIHAVASFSAAVPFNIANINPF